ncbi:MAG TPA: alpha/beta hydrolase fold domain-containing protein [Ilumatobacteraceae bacterium]|nr:alpha/beta hydrolase fold domain-containing protein [Ilumatobacteraceae bacterium]
MSEIAGRDIHVEPPASLDDIGPLRELVAGGTDDWPSIDGVGSTQVDVSVWPERGLTGELYRPAGVDDPPVVLWMHGGGWCTGSAASARETPLRLCGDGVAVLNLDYSLAPEHPYPSAVEECLYALRWLTMESAGLGVDGSRLAIGGCSAGANLAAAVLVHLAGDRVRPLDDGGSGHVTPDVAAALLLYGVFDYPTMNQSPGSNAGFVEVLFNRGYLGPSFLTVGLESLASPARSARLAGFPSTYLSCGSLDSLLGQSLVMAERLAAADVDVTLSVPGGLDHSFDVLEDRRDEARAEMARARRWLLDRLAPAARNANVTRRR